MPTKPKISPEELKVAIDEYQELCKEEEKPFTFIGLSNYLNIHEDTLTNYSKQEAFSEHIKKARSIAKESLIIGGLTNKYNPTMAIFLAKVNHGMQDKQVIEQDTEVTFKFVDE